MFTCTYPVTQRQSPNPQRIAPIARLIGTAAVFSVVTSAALAANPVGSDGYRFVGGEMGYVYEGSTAAGQSMRGQLGQDFDSLRRSPVLNDGYRFVGGEAGFVYEGMAPSALGSGTGARGLTRAQVERELMEFKRNPVSADGQWRYIGGEQGWIRR